MADRPTGTPLIITLPDLIVKAQTLENDRRVVFFESSREGVEDREGEDISAQALWDSRQLFLDQGWIDINHWSILGNPYGSGAKPEYTIGRPIEVQRDGPSIYVKAEIFNPRENPPVGSPGAWADYLWDSLSNLTPNMKWFPSVFGTIKPGGRTTKKLHGKTINYIKGLEWFSVGLAQRAQHPDLPPVSLDPMGPFAKGKLITKAPGVHTPVFNATRLRQHGALVMDLKTLSKAMTVGAPITDASMKTGVQALTPTSMDGTVHHITPGAGEPPYRTTARRILKAVLSGKQEPTLDSLSRAFRKAGCSEQTAAEYAHRMLIDAAHGRVAGE